MTKILHKMWRIFLFILPIDKIVRMWYNWPSAHRRAGRFLPGDGFEVQN